MRVPQAEAKLGEYRMQHYVERQDLTIVHEVAHLPAYAAHWMKASNAFLDHSPLLCQILVEVQAALVGFAEVVWW